MKWWKKLLIGVLFLACVIGVGTWIIFQGNSEKSNMPRETLEPAPVDEEVPSYEDAADKEVSSYEEERAKQKVPSHKETANKGRNISDKAMEKLFEKLDKRKSAVILDCDKVTTPENMPVYQKEALKPLTEAQILSLLNECAGDNPDSKKYRLSETPRVGFVPSQEVPIQIDFLTEQRIQGFLYERRWYDLRPENPSKLSRKTAIMKAETFLKKLFPLLGLHCDIMPSEQWEIEETAVSTDEEALDVYHYENPGGRDEKCYQMEMSCLLDGYPLFSSIDMRYERNKTYIFGDHFFLCYGASGWVKIDCTYPYDFRKTKKTYPKLLSMKQAAKSLEKRLKLKDDDDGFTIFIATDARLGYFVTDEKELRPVWYFSGIARNAFNEDAIYLIDAVTGKQLMKSEITNRR